MIVTVPGEDGAAWPSLGWQVCDWIEANLVFGPGDLRGEVAKVDAEKEALIWRAYEVYPRGSRDRNGKDISGRRRFRRVALSLQKGSAKTELAAWIAAAELAPNSPVRFIGWRDDGKPLGGPVPDPYLALVAYTEEQSEDLAYAALKVILELSPIAEQFDIGFERIIRRHGGGKAVALAAAPDSRDGARTTFQHKDETHRWTLPRLKRAHQTMLANLPKRLMADPWELETTVAYSPGENSVAEDTAEYARQVATGKIQDSRLFYFHRQAGDNWNLEDPEQLRRAIAEAAGPNESWRDIEGIADQWQDPKADRQYLERVYLNRPVATAAQAFDGSAWAAGRRPKSGRHVVIKPGELITLGFDGSQVEDSTALVACHVRTGFMWLAGIWEKNGEDWHVPVDEVMATVSEAAERWSVFRMYCDPSKWGNQVRHWQGEIGMTVVHDFKAQWLRRMAQACADFAHAIRGGDVIHDGDPVLAAHIGAAQKRMHTFLDEDGLQMWTIQKERENSPKKIDAAQAAVLAWNARQDAIASGALAAGPQWSGVYIPEDDMVTA